MTSRRAFNTTIYSKLTWMGRRLRDMNDHQSLMTLVNAINHVKSLLIPTPFKLNATSAQQHKDRRLDICLP